MKKEIGEGLGISGMTLGILSIISAGLTGIILSVIGFILSYVQQRNNPTKIGKWGMILGIIGFILSIVFILVFYLFLNKAIA